VIAVYHIGTYIAILAIYVPIEGRTEKKGGEEKSGEFLFIAFVINKTPPLYREAG